MNGISPGRNGRPRWAPRVPQNQLRRLYEGIAGGLVDDELVDEIGFTLYLRCNSILLIRDIFHRRILPCPQCGRNVGLGGGGWSEENVDFVLHCDACQWTLPWGDYWATFRHQELWAEGASDIVEEYVHCWGTASDQTSKILAIDRVIHRWHWETKTQHPSFGVGRPTGVNLIEGSRKDVIAFLDGLTYGPSSPNETTETRDTWRARWQDVKDRQSGARAARDMKPGSSGFGRRPIKREGD